MPLFFTKERKRMKGLVIINGYPADEKFLRQGERIASALSSLGVAAEVVKNGEISVCIREGNPVCKRAEGYSFAVYLDKDKYLGSALEACGLRLFNAARAVELCDDKLLTYQALQGKNVRLIESIPAPLCYTQGAEPSESFLQSVGERLGFPLVAKKSYGSFGAAVELVHGYAELCEIEAKWLHVPHFYQRYVAKAAGRDVRVIVVGGKALAGMERCARGGEFRSNIELGGVGRAIPLTREVQSLAERAAEVLGLDYCGVDVMEDEDGAMLCEVNSNAFFEGFEEATGIDVAKAYASHIVQAMR